MQSRIDVDGTVLFVENSAMTGGGLALEDQSLVIIIAKKNLSQTYNIIMI